MLRRRTLWLFTILVALVLAGAVVVLTTATVTLAISDSAFLDHHQYLPALHEQPTYHPPHPEGGRSYRPSHNASAPERIPRIIHQTWKTETLPGKWSGLAQGCKDMHPTYEYMLWTDAKSREFIAKEYPWFLDTYDDYRYPIQRADAIRYFILHHFGGVYLDLDVGCLRPLDPLLIHQVILPKTIPVGVSNDIMFAEPGHPFMAQTIHNLVTFDHSWWLNYPTVMFSTGPMFLSAQYGIYTTAHSVTPETPGGDVRILPRALYGKNAKPEEAPHPFFAHYYGSSWHADDAAFVGFLAHWGRGLMVLGFALMILGAIRLSIPSARARRKVAVIFPRWSSRRGRFQFSFRGVTLSIGPGTQPPSPTLPPSPVPSLDDEDVFTLQLPLDLRSRASSPAPSDRTDVFPSRASVLEHPVVDAVARVGRGLTAIFGPPGEGPRAPRRTSSSVLFTVLSPNADDYELSRQRRSPPPEYSETLGAGSAAAVARLKNRSSDELERGDMLGLHAREPYVRPTSRAVTPTPSSDGSPVETPFEHPAASYFGPRPNPARSFLAPPPP